MTDVKVKWLVDGPVGYFDLVEFSNNNHTVRRNAEQKHVGVSVFGAEFFDKKETRWTIRFDQARVSQMSVGIDNPSKRIQYYLPVGYPGLAQRYKDGIVEGQRSKCPDSIRSVREWKTIEFTANTSTGNVSAALNDGPTWIVFSQIPNLELFRPFVVFHSIDQKVTLL
jgi:hypothetical protein